MEQDTHICEELIRGSKDITQLIMSKNKATKDITKFIKSKKSNSFVLLGMQPESCHHSKK